MKSAVLIIRSRETKRQAFIEGCQCGAGNIRWRVNGKNTSLPVPEVRQTAAGICEGAMTNETQKKNIDYSGKAVNLCNPAEIGGKLEELQSLEQQIALRQKELWELPQVKEFEAWKEQAGEIKQQY